MMIKRLLLTLLFVPALALSATNHYNIGDQTNITGASFTNSTLLGTTTLPGLNPSSLMLTNGSRVLSSYLGAACTNQALYSLSVAGAGSCTSTFAGGGHTAMTALGIRSNGIGAFDLTLANSENLTAGRALTFKVNDAARTIDLGGNLTLGGTFTTSGSSALTLTTTGTTNVTLPTTGTLFGTAASSIASAQLRASLSDESGTGAAYFQGGDLGTPSAGVLTNGTGLPILTGVSGLGTGVATFLATPSSANLRSALTDETGTGALVFAGGNIGAATATSINGNTITTGTGTLTLAASKTLTLSNTLTFTGTDASTVAFGAGGTVLYSGGALGTPASGVATNLTGTAAGLTAGNVTTNANLTGPITSTGNATAVAAQTGTGSTFVMQASPTLTTPNIGAATGTSVALTGSASSLGANGNASTAFTLNAAAGTGQGAYHVIASAGTAKTYLGTYAAIFGSGTDQSALLHSVADNAIVDAASGKTASLSVNFTNIVTAAAAGASITGTLQVSSGGSANKAICWKTGTTLGFCSSVVAADGSCTCN